MNCKLVSHWIDHMFELVYVVFGETRAWAWRGFPGSQHAPNVQGILFTVLSCREISELVTQF